MAQLLDQCPEVLHNIFLFTHPSDLGSLLQTCHFIHDIIQNDSLLWKKHYLQLFDCPSRADDFNDNQSIWQNVLKEAVAMQKVLECEDETVKLDESELQRVCLETFNLFLNTTSNPINAVGYFKEQFHSESNISSFLCRSSLFQRCRFRTDDPASTQELRQLSAKLQVFYGLEVEPPFDAICDTASATQVHPYARSRVYDLRRYTEGNMWGPFMDDGSQRTDWEKLQSIMIILLYNLRMYTERRRGREAGQEGSQDGSPSSRTSNRQLWDQPFQGLAPHSYVSTQLQGPLAPPVDPDLNAQDPYGVTGTWMRIVCFLDYNDLYSFNFESEPIPVDQERGPIDTREAFRLIRLQLRITQVEPAGISDKTGSVVVHFEGTSKSTYMAWDPNANSRIRGTVRTTPTGDIRWTTFSIFHGEERWRSEGVQIGGIQSARGVLGNWFDKDYNEHGPAGPTAFWKISDDIVEDKKPLFTSWQEIINVVFEQQ